MDLQHSTVKPNIHRIDCLLQPIKQQLSSNMSNTKQRVTIMFVKNTDKNYTLLKKPLVDLQDSTITPNIHRIDWLLQPIKQQLSSNISNTKQRVTIIFVKNMHENHTPLKRPLLDFHDFAVSRIYAIVSTDYFDQLNNDDLQTVVRKIPSRPRRFSIFFEKIKQRKEKN